MESKVGLDLDGVLCDWVQSYTNFMHRTQGLERLTATDEKIENFSLQPFYQSPEQFKEGYAAWLDQYDPFINIPDINKQDTDYVSIMNNIPNGMNLSFITAREQSNGHPVVQQTAAWLEFRGISNPQVYVRRDKGKVCAALGIDFFLDDRVENLDVISLHSPQTVPVLMRRPYNDHISRYTPVNKVSEYFDLIRSRL